MPSPEAGETIQSLAPPAVEQEEELIKPILVSAGIAGLEPAVLHVNLVAASGIIKVNGDFQITGPLTPFPEPFRVLATDETGNPLPPGTEVRFSPSLARCADLFVPTDSNGFAEVNCIGEEISPVGGATQDGNMAVSIDSRRDLPTGGVLNSRLSSVRPPLS